MLNKQKSKKMNSLKYGLVLPVLAAFMLLFQVKTVAQEKKSYSSVIESKVKVVEMITKDSKDEELKEKKKVFKEEFDTDVDFQNVKRNDKSEITAVKVTVKDKTQSQVYEVAGTEPISPFTIEVEKDDAGRKSIAFGNGNKSPIVRGDNFKIFGDPRKGDTIVADRKMIIKGRGSVDNIPAPPTPPNFPEDIIARGQGTSMKFGDTDALIVINGVKQKKGAEIKLQPGEDVAEINVLKDKEAKNKYGKEGKKGVIEITTRKGPHVRMGRLAPLHGNGHAYAITIPEGEFNFDFDFNMDDLGDMDVFRFNGMEDMQRMFEDMGRNFSFSTEMNDEQMADVMERIKEAQEKLQSAMPEIKRELKNNGLSEKEYKEALEEAKKGMDEARKEMEKARKDLENARKQMNKKA